MYQAQKVSGISVLEVMIYHVPSPESERYLCVRGNDLPITSNTQIPLTFWAWYMVNHYLQHTNTAHFLGLVHGKSLPRNDLPCTKLRK
jgi:hypothetical protein